MNISTIVPLTEPEQSDLLQLLRVVCAAPAHDAPEFAVVQKLMTTNVVAILARLEAQVGTDPLNMPTKDTALLAVEVDAAAVAYAAKKG